MNANQINDQFVESTLTNIKRSASIKVRGYEKDDKGKSTGLLLYEFKTEKASFDFEGLTFGNLLILALAHCKVIAQNKVRDLGEDVVRETFSQPIKVTELITERAPAGAKTTQTLVGMEDTEFDEYIERITKIRKQRKTDKTNNTKEE